MATATDETRIAVVDIGSNTASLAVYAANRVGSLVSLADRSEALRLMRRIGPDGRFPTAAIELAVEEVRQFVQEARRMGASDIVVVATSAVRDALNGGELARRFRAAVGLELRIVDGETEADFAAVAAANTLPVTDGFVVDIGGGSLQIAELRDRRCVRSASLPLGALRLTDAFGPFGPASWAEITALRRHVAEQLAGIPWFRAHGTLVGIGGSIRALAKMDRRARQWPVSENHGYLLEQDAVEAVWERVSRADAEGRRAIPGLSAPRADLIVPGALTVSWLLRVSGFDAIRVCGYGVREGVAFERLLGKDWRVGDVREAGLVARFPGTRGSWPGREAAAVATGLHATLSPALGLDPALRSLFAISARIRIASGGGRAPAPADVLLEAPLPGFVHEEILTLVDLLSSAARFRIDSGEHRRLRILLDLLTASGPKAGGLRVEGARVIVPGARLEGELSRRFSATFGKELAAG
jgi:exopolyphosphatase/guanosine-5'-triphosphate,3'-diphosphate pyrophosphatase